MAEPNIAEAERRIREAVEAGNTKLYLRRLDLTEAPASLAALKNLDYLDLSGNNLTSIPEWLSKLESLRTLVVSDNWLSSLPDSLGELPLSILNANYNRFKTMPRVVTKFGGLAVLMLEYNQLSEQLPNAIGQLGNLVVLNLAGNQLTELPDEVGLIQDLTQLNLAGNRLTDLPDSLCQIQKLDTLDLRGNPFTGELAEVVRRGTPAVLEFLRGRATAQIRQWRAKLMLVGEGGVGKTNLLRRLKGESFIGNNEPTHNLEIRQLGIAHPSEAGVTIDLRAWDFGGQFFMHATHQFFYSGKSVFLMVWNARDNFEQSKLPHWLDRIQALAPDSPVLLVATHGERFKPNIPLQEIKARYPNVRELRIVDTADPTRGVDQLRSAILDLALGLDHVGQRRPASWAKASEIIRTHPDPYLETPKFLQLLERAGVPNPADYAEQLNMVGEITFFSRNPIYNPSQPELEDVVILKPDWLLQKISLVLESEQVKNARGSFNSEHQGQVWKDLSRGIQEYLLRLMEHFDLAYRTETHPVRGIVVELCPEDRPARALEEWEASQQQQVQFTGLEFRFETTIPPGLPTWFIARCHRLTAPDYHWRRGAVLHDRERRHIALIQSDLDSRKVFLTVRGPLPYNFFALLRDCFEGTLERFAGLARRVDRVIPCNGAPKCPGFRIEALEAMLQRRITEIPCQECLTRHSIAQLLMGVHPYGDQEIMKQLHAIDHKLDAHHEETIEYLQREFFRLFKRDQSLAESHCPPVFTLEVERLPDILPTILEGMWRDLSETPLPMNLTLYCNQPGEWHPVKTYRIQPPAKLLARLAPVARKLAPVISAAKELIPSAELIGRGSRAGLEGMKEFLKQADWTDKVSPILERLGEHPEAIEAGGLGLHHLRDLLTQTAPEEVGCWGGLLKTVTPQFHVLWLCEEHRVGYLLR